MNSLRLKTVQDSLARVFYALLLLATCLVALVDSTPVFAQASLVTQRFGEQSSCDVQNVTRDARVRSDQPTFNAGDETVLYYRYADSAILMHFDLTAIPVGAKIRQARFRLFFSYDFHDGGHRGVLKTLHKINDPNDTGLWDEMQATFSQKRQGTAWAHPDGSLDAVKGPAIGSLYFRNWEGFTQDFIDADITGAVQDWVDDPAANNGFLFDCNDNFNMRLAACDYEDASRRPYLEITFEGPQDQLIDPPTAIGAVYHSGQTFLTWTEAQTGFDETSYRIYRSDSPITTANLDQAEWIDQVYQGSSYLSDTMTIKQPDLSPIDVNLAENSGLYVYTVENAQSSYWAVTTVVEGNENRILTAGINATPTALVETVDLPDKFFFDHHKYGLYEGYVMWLGRFNPADPTDDYGFDNRRSVPVFFSVAEPHEFDEQKKYPLTIYLHAWGHNYFDSTEGVDNSRYVDEQHWGGYSINFNDVPRLIVRNAAGELLDLGPYIETDLFGYSYYTGWNSNYVPASVEKGFAKTFEPQRPYEDGRSVLYSEKAIMFIVDWMLTRSQWASSMDSERVYATGSSMGASGSLFLGIHYPEKFAAVNAFHGRTTIYYEAEGKYCHYAERQFGDLEMNIPTPEGIGVYDYMNVAKCLQRDPARPYPIIRMAHGRNDATIPWSQVPGTYRAANQARLGFYAYFDQGGHNDPVEAADFPEYIDQRDFVADQHKPQFNLFHFSTSQSFPAFSDFSLNDDYGDGSAETGDLIGGINRFPCWQIDSVTDTTDQWSAVIFLLDEAPVDNATVTVTPRQLQSLANTPEVNYQWRNVRVSDGAVLQSGALASDKAGLINIGDVLINKEPSRLEIFTEAAGMPQNVEGLLATLDYADTLSAPVGAWVSVWGIGFGVTRDGNLLKIGSVEAVEIHQWTDTRIDFRVPEAAVSGPLRVVVGDHESNRLDFVVREGAIYHVRPESASADDAHDGSVDAPWKTLAKAVASVAPGDTVYLGSGTFGESLIPAVSGSAGLPIMFKAYPGLFPLLDGSGLGGTPDGIRLDGSVTPGIGYYIFSGLTLHDFDESIFMVSGARDCNFYDMDVAYGRGGLFFYGASGSFVAQSRFHHQAEFGVVFNNHSSDIYIRDCESDHNGATEGSGFESDATVENVTLFRCRAHHNAGAGFDMKVDDLLLNECAAYDNVTGIQIEGSSHVQNTWVFNNEERGILCAPAAGQTPTQTLVNCSVVGEHSIAGIEVADGTDISIRNTISVGTQGPALLLQGVYAESVISHCIFQTAGVEMPVVVWGGDTGSSSVWSASQINEGLFAAATNQSETLMAGIAPGLLFKDYLSGDLMLRSSSPARNFGDSTDAPSYDYYRSPRDGEDGSFDIGAIEYQVDGFSAAGEAWVFYQ